ncbi:MAG: Dabb family protein [Chloroflexi bacterium]|nr:Dabb family protein [Chloroflexota bacterium]
MASITGAKLIHSLLFSFKEGVTEEQKEAFFKAAKAMAQVPGIMGVDIGPNLENPPYQYTGIIYYRDAEARQAFLPNPIHRHFVEEHYLPLTEKRVSTTTVAG